MNENKIEKLWITFIQELENKQAFSDYRNNNQMPLSEREELFKNYLLNWTKTQNLEKDTNQRLFNYSIYY